MLSYNFNHIKLIIIILLINVKYISNLALPVELGGKSNKCTRERVFKLIGYNCAELNLKDIPQYLQTNTEVLDASFNRIRDLGPHSFARYTSIQYLYLFENFIQTIDDGTFTILTDLEVLNLNENALHTIPLEILNLPKLRNLYVGGNNLKHLNNDLEQIPKPISAPLQLLHLPNAKLQNVPNFGILPELIELNMSSNPLREIMPQDFSPMCNLKIIDLNHTSMSSCLCQLIVGHIKRRGVIIKNFVPYCTYLSEDCPDSTNATLETPDYDLCLFTKAESLLHQKATITWVIILSVLGGALIIFIGLLYCCHRKNVKKQKQTQQLLAKQRAEHTEENGNNEGLISNETRTYSS